ncbi:MAG: DUF488 family protein [Deltaproteobacteria bacterium]|nr:DUF488 family protein [Deltaproteobacteria bacterium]
MKLKRVYEPAEPQDGARFLVERLWPRGVSKERAQLTDWLRDLGPSPELRQWYAHDLARWDEFAQRYTAELAQPARAPLLARLRQAAAEGPLTLVFATRDAEHSSAWLLRKFLEDQPAPEA